MDEKLLLPIFGSIILISILILGIFSIKIILFPNKTYKEQEIELKEEIQEALNNLLPKLSIEKESSNEILEIFENNTTTLKEIKMKEINTIIKEELLYQKLKKDEDIKIKINILKKEEQQKCLIAYFETIKKHLNNLSDEEINEILKYMSLLQILCKF